MDSWLILVDSWLVLLDSWYLESWGFPRNPPGSGYLQGFYQEFSRNPPGLGATRKRPFQWPWLVHHSWRNSPGILQEYVGECKELVGGCQFRACFILLIDSMFEGQHILPSWHWDWLSVKTVGTDTKYEGVPIFQPASIIDVTTLCSLCMNKHGRLREDITHIPRVVIKYKLCACWVESFQSALPGRDGRG